MKLRRRTSNEGTPVTPTSPAKKRTAAQSEAELAELRDAVLDDWLVVTTSVTGALHDIQQTVSWKVTKPLRLGRLLQKKVGEVGVVPASQLAAAAVARRLGR